MQNIQLYIEGQRVDMFKDESVEITQTIKNVQDLDKVFTDFSRTFSLPATKINNKIFKHYYNFDIVNGFDARTKKSSNIELNSLPFRDGKIKLEGVDLKDNKPHTYRITFFGNTVTLKDLFGDDKLSSLSSLTAFNQPYDSAGIKQGLQANSLLNDVIVPLITHTRRLFYNSHTGHAHDDNHTGNLFYQQGSGHEHGVLYSDLKYAIRLHNIIEAIESKYDITFSDDFFVATNKPYHNLFMWLHRKKGEVQNLTGVNQSIVSGFTNGTDTNTQTEMTNGTTLEFFGDSQRYNQDTELRFFSTTTTPYNVSLQKDGVQLLNILAPIGGNLVIDQIEFDGFYTIYIESEGDINFTSIEWFISYEQLPYTKSYQITNYDHIDTFEFDITQQIPEMKVIDFVSGLFKTFNLVAYVEKNTDVIIVKTLNEFYEDGNVYDISKFVDNTKSSVNISLPYREINFQHEDTNTFLAAIHNQKFNKVWGKSEYTNGEKLDGGIYSIKTPFSQMKYERLYDVNGGSATTVQVGYFVDDNQESYFGKPLIFYPITQTSSTPISFLTTVTHHEPITNYNIPSNHLSLVPALSKYNINFYNEVDEYLGSNLFTDTLFQAYYSDYITSVFNPKNRITKVTAYLPLKILLNYTLADKFIMGDHQYKINSIKTNFKNGKSEIELLNDL
jgi:hypothetical protein